MKNFYEMMRLLEGDGNIDPRQIQQMQQQARNMTNGTLAVRTLWSLFRRANPNMSPQQAFSQFEAMLGAISEKFYYPGESDWSRVGFEGLDPEWLKAYTMY